MMISLLIESGVVIKDVNFIKVCVAVVSIQYKTKKNKDILKLI